MIRILFLQLYSWLVFGESDPDIFLIVRLFCNVKSCILCFREIDYDPANGVDEENVPELERVRRIDCLEVRSRLSPIQYAGSIASDIDVSLDWYSIAELEENNKLNQKPIFYTAIVFCSIGSFVWLVATFDILFYRVVDCILYCPKQSTDSNSSSYFHKSWFIPLINIFLEDVPQVVMTLLVTLIYKDDNFNQTTAIINIATSTFAISFKFLDIWEN